MSEKKLRLYAVLGFVITLIGLIVLISTGGVVTTAVAVAAVFLGLAVIFVSYRRLKAMGGI